MCASRSGELVVISGPSGVGKSSIIDAIIERTDSIFSVSATTREPRTGEIDGVDYRFVSREMFEDAIQRDVVLEWAEYGGNLYGTMHDQVVPALASGTNVVLDIENEGAKQVRAAYPGAVLIFITPPDLSELGKRLRGRGDTSQRDVERRLSVASRQITEAPEVYDHIIENRGLETAISQVLDILKGPSASAQAL